MHYCAAKRMGAKGHQTRWAVGEVLTYFEFLMVMGERLRVGPVEILLTYSRTQRRFYRPREQRNESNMRLELFKCPQTKVVRATELGADPVLNEGLK